MLKRKSKATKKTKTLNKLIFNNYTFTRATAVYLRSTRFDTHQFYSI